MNNLNINLSNKPKQTITRESEMTNSKSQNEKMAKLPKIKIAYTNLIDYLKILLHQKAILTNPSYIELSKMLAFTYNFVKDKKTALKSHYPQKRTYNDLYNRLSKRYKTQLQQEWPTIEKKFTHLYKIAFPSDPRIPSMIKSPIQSIKRKFFNDIKQIIQQYFPKARIFDTDLSRIFYSKARTLKDSHFKRNRTHRKLTMSILFAFIYSIRKLTKSELKGKVRDIKKVDKDTLKNLKIHLESYIENFVFSNPYKAKYINDRYNIGAKYFKPEYVLTLNIWYELSLRNKKPILIKVAQRIINYTTFGRFDKFGLKGRGHHYSWDGLIQMIKQLVKLLQPTEFYRLVPKIKKYIKIRNLHPIQPRIYHRSWYTKSTIKFHIIILILRDLGLEILNLDPIKPITFKKTDIMENYTYERHHIFPNDKFSIDVNRLVLTMHKNHAKLERKKYLICQLIQSRINLTRECPHYYKTRFSDWQTRWQKYLKRRIYLIENGIEKFIKRFFTDDDGNNYIIERFFKLIPEGQIATEIASMIRNWIKKKRSVPILNPIIIDRLVKGTPELTLRGYNIT